MKRYPEDVRPGDYLVPLPEGAAHYGLPHAVKVEMVSVLKVSTGEYYSFQVYAAKLTRRRRIELGSAWFSGFAQTLQGNAEG